MTERCPPFLFGRRRLLGAALASPAWLAGCSMSGWVAAVTPSDHYQRIDGVPYASGARRAVDVYVPNAIAARGPGAHAPTVVFFYGGRWQAGTRSNYAFVGEALASRGFVVAVADYRVYPEVTFPAFVEDAAHAVAWMRVHAPRYGGDPARLVVAGHSAGAHIAVLLALDRDYLAAAGAPDTIAGAIGISGPYDFLPLKSERLQAVFGAPDGLARTQPIRYARADAPPLLLLHGTADTTVAPANTQRLTERVRASGGRAQAKLYPGKGHIGMIVALAAPLRAGETVLDDIAVFANQVQL